MLNAVIGIMYLYFTQTFLSLHNQQSLRKSWKLDKNQITDNLSLMSLKR